MQKKAVAGGEIQRIIYPFFKQWTRTNGLVVKTGSRELVHMGLIPDEC